MIRLENIGAAVAALHDWAEDYDAKHQGYLDAEFGDDTVYELLNAHSIHVALTALGWDPIFDDVPNGNVIGLDQHTFDNTTDTHRSAMAALHGVVEPQSYLTFHDHEGEIFQWLWGTHNFVFQRNGRIVFEVTE